LLIYLLYKKAAKICDISYITLDQYNKYYFTISNVYITIHNI